MSEDDSEEIRAHELIWKKVFDETDAVLADFIRKNLVDKDDYWIVDEDWGWNVVQIELPLSSMWPPIVKKLQLVLAQYPDWQITIRLAQRPDGWPGMGIIISHDKIIDDLKRDYFPPEFRNISFD